MRSAQTQRPAETLNVSSVIFFVHLSRFHAFSTHWYISFLSLRFLEVRKILTTALARDFDVRSWSNQYISWSLWKIWKSIYPQIHKIDDDACIFSITLREVTPLLPELRRIAEERILMFQCNALFLKSQTTLPRRPSMRLNSQDHKGSLRRMKLSLASFGSSERRWTLDSWGAKAMMKKLKAAEAKTSSAAVPWHLFSMHSIVVQDSAGRLNSRVEHSIVVQDSAGRLNSRVECETWQCCSWHEHGDFWFNHYQKNTVVT